VCEGPGQQMAGARVVHLPFQAVHSGYQAHQSPDNTLMISGHLLPHTTEQRAIYREIQSDNQQKQLAQA